MAGEPSLEIKPARTQSPHWTCWSAPYHGPTVETVEGLRKEVLGLGEGKGVAAIDTDSSSIGCQPITIPNKRRQSFMTFSLSLTWAFLRLLTCTTSTRTDRKSVV